MPGFPSANLKLLAVLPFVMFPQSAWSQTDPAALSGLVIDDTQARFTGDWQSSTTIRPYLGASYRHDGGEGKGEKSAQFPMEVENSGQYTVLVAYTAGGNRDKAVPITVKSAEEV
jgi:hypothetical protein